MKRKNNLRRVLIAVLCISLTVFGVTSDYLKVPISVAANTIINAYGTDKIVAMAESESVTTTTVAVKTEDVAHSVPQTTTVPTTTMANAVAVSSNAKGKISNVTLNQNGATSVSNLHIANKTGKTVDVAAQLKVKPDFTIYKNASPQVLIVHTHATECYFPKESDVYYDDWATRTADKSKNTVAVGQIITDKLNAAGIVTLHDETLHDKDAYNGSYERARKTIQSYLDKYPSIDVVLDIHRDAITYDDGTKVSPTIEIDGKKAAQIMIATGCNSGNVTDHDNWIENFRFAIRLQKSCEEKYGKFARPLYFVSKKYNHDLTPGSLLIEMGSEANTLEQVKYSAELLSNALISVLDGLQAD